MQESWEDEEEEKKDEEKKDVVAAPPKPKKKIADKIAEKEVISMCEHMPLSDLQGHRIKLAKLVWFEKLFLGRLGNCYYLNLEF